MHLWTIQRFGKRGFYANKIPFIGWEKFPWQTLTLRETCRLVCCDAYLDYLYCSLFGNFSNDRSRTKQSYTLVYGRIGVGYSAEENDYPLLAHVVMHFNGGFTPGSEL